MKKSDLKQIIKECIKEVLSERNSYELYHPSFSSAASAAKEHAERQGYEISEDDWFREVSTSYPGRPRNGDTSKFHVPVTKDGKPQNRNLHFQVADLQNGKYELNAYIQEGKLQKDEDLLKPSVSESKKKSDEEKRRAAARREAEKKAGFKMPKGGVIPSGKSKAKQKDKKQGRKPVKD